MSIESFLKLKEIDSLSKMRNTQIKAKADQENRVYLLNLRREETLNKSKVLQDELILKHSIILNIENKIRIASEQRQRLTDIGSDEKKISSFSTDISHLENQGLDCLSKIDEIESELNDYKNFLLGLDKTILEIKDEVMTDLDLIQIEIKNLDLRIQLLEDELPDHFKAILKSLNARHLAHGPFTRLDQGSCYFCRFKVSRLDESEIDMRKNLKNCQQCSRIFLPYGS